MQKGSKQSPDAIRKMREAKLGKITSEATKEKLRLVHSTHETKEKNRLAHLGKRDSLETRLKKSAAHTGEKNAFYGKRHTPEALSKMTGRPFSEEHKQRLSDVKKGTSPKNIEVLKQSRVGKTNSEEQNRKHSETMRIPEVRDRMSHSHQGDRNSNWNGGISPLYKNIRESSKYYEWRDAVYARDNYTDVITGEKGNGNLNAHHIVQFAHLLEIHHIETFEQAMACEELWDVANGITLTEKTHAIIHGVNGITRKPGGMAASSIALSEDIVTDIKEIIASQATVLIQPLQ